MTDLGACHVLGLLDLESGRSMSEFESAKQTQAFSFLLSVFFLSSLQCSFPSHFMLQYQLNADDLGGQQAGCI